MITSLIVALSENRVIGRDNKLPWYLPEDLKYFKKVTLGKPIIMGRKTFESIGRPLPGRLNIVVTRQTDWQHPGVAVATSLDAAIARGEAQALLDGATEVMIIGGEQIYRAALPRVQRLYLSEVHARVEGDAFFPEVTLSQWKEVAREDFAAQAPNPYDYSFVVYDRIDVQ
ncbi:MAG: dihydrofolate reductase [Hahellaceae bacterium]|nr:dihydrofolate reductase [Hahellaceae bacterium]MCP5169883.1 dihydrofolate reductase [Hahellaceae bacterium]